MCQSIMIEKRLESILKLDKIFYKIKQFELYNS